jgi:hypothetical protein
MAGGIDTSIYKTPEQPNPLLQLGQLIQLNNAQTQGQISQETLNRLTSDRAVGGAFQQAVSPDGSVDVNKLGALIAKDPRAAYGAAQGLVTANTLKGGQISNEQGATQLGLTRQGALSNGLAGLVSDPTLSRQTADRFVDQQIAAGVIPADRGAQIKSEYAGMDGRALRAYVRGHFNTISGVQNATPTNIGTTPQGAPVIGTRGQAVEKMTTQGGIVPELAPGQAGAQAVDLEGAAKRGQSLNEQADQVPQRKATLNNMLGLLGEFQSGKGAKTEANYRSALGRFGLDPGTSVTGATEEFAKLANQIAAQQASQLGTTDQQQKTVMGANPSTEFSKLGNERVIAVLKGNEDAIAAKRSAFQQFKEANPQGSYDQFSAGFNREFEPRVFQYLNMNKAQREDFRKSMTPDQQKAFSASANKAIANGWIGKPNAQ